MSRIVELSTGESVHFKDKYTRKAEKTYKAAQNKGVVIQEAADGTQTREIPAENAERATEAVIGVLVEKIVKGTTESTVSESWLDELPLEDFEKLVEMVLVMFRESRDGAGKKNS